MNIYIEKFSQSMTESGKSRNTIATYTRNAGLFVEWLESIISEKFNGKITGMDVAEYTKYLTDTKKQSLNSIKAKLTALQKFAEYLTNAGYMQPIKVQQKKGTAEPDVDLKTISSIAGHSNTELTMKYYINSSKQEQTDAVESLSFF